MGMLQNEQINLNNKTSALRRSKSQAKQQRDQLHLNFQQRNSWVQLAQGQAKVSLKKRNH